MVNYKERFSALLSRVYQFCSFEVNKSFSVGLNINNVVQSFRVLKPVKFRSRMTVFKCSQILISFIRNFYWSDTIASCY